MLRGEPGDFVAGLRTDPQGHGPQSGRRVKKDERSGAFILVLLLSPG